jgi:hypothetical protein
MPVRRFPPPWSVEELDAATRFLTSADTANARVYVCGVGPVSPLLPGSTAPTMRAAETTSSGALRQSRRLNPFSGGFAL